jgi:glycosyltransferase involved in cell wall biosynthesis
MTSTPLISVITPCFNYAKYLPDLFNSLINQTYSNWECLVVDDGSIDDTKEVVTKYSIIDSRIKYIHQLNSGPSTARINGLKNVNGTYIQFIDADDLIAKEKFALEVSIFNLHPEVGVVYSDYLLVDEQLTKYWKDSNTWNILSEDSFYDFIKLWENGLMIPLHSFLYKKDCFNLYGSFNEGFKTKEDWDLHLNLSSNGVKFLYHNYVGVFYRIQDKSSSRTNPLKNKNDLLNVLSKYFSKKTINLKYKRVILNRYADFVVQFIVEKLVFNQINLVQVIQTQNRVLNAFLLLILPFKLFVRILKMFKNKTVKLFKNRIEKNA